jgi:hypothetical protein
LRKWCCTMSRSMAVDATKDASGLRSSPLDCSRNVVGCDGQLAIPVGGSALKEG